MSRARLGSICLLSYAIGVLLSPYFLPTDFLTDIVGPLFANKLQTQHNRNDATEGGSDEPLKYAATYQQVIGGDTTSDPFHDVAIVLHRNGEPDPCTRQEQASSTNSISITPLLGKIFELLGINTIAATTNNVEKDSFSPLSQSILRSAERFEKEISFNNKYEFDAIITSAFAMEKPSIFPDDPDILSSYCYMGKDKTPIQPDHHELVTVPLAGGSLPCHFHTREGVRITSLSQLADLAREATKKNVQGECKATDGKDDQTCSSSSSISDDSTRKELHLYAVSAGRVFMFAPKYVGEVFELPHVKGPEGLPVSLQVMSLNPRVFDIYNFFDRTESAAIVDKALKETSETHKMKRSSTGASGYNLNSKRTSENGFDTHGKEAMIVKHRCMDILGFDAYEESLTDGLQVLRYNKTTGYYPHLDWIDDPRKKEEHNFDSAGVGSNRFATILLYMSDLEESDGGETLFSHGWPVGQPEEEHVHLNDALDTLRESGDVEGLLKRDSWEESMVANCRTRLAVRPHSSRAVLFYSQHPDGSEDKSSLHGGCPVIKGEK